LVFPLLLLSYADAADFLFFPFLLTNAPVNVATATAPMIRIMPKSCGVMLDGIIVIGVVVVSAGGSVVGSSVVGGSVVGGGV